MNLHDWLPDLLTLGVVTQHRNHDNGPDGEEEITFRAGTVVKLLWTLIGVGAIGMVSATRFAWEANDERRNINEAIRALSAKVDKSSSDPWTGAMQHYYTDEFSRKNPMIQAPDSESIQRKLSR